MSTLACRIELSKEGGVTITVRDTQGEMVQTARLDGKSITLSCRDSEDESSIVQKPDSITVKCKHFEVDADSVELKSREDTTCECGGQLVAKAKSDLELSSEAGISARARSDLTLFGRNVKSAASEQATFSGATTKLEGSQELSAEGTKLALHADLEAELVASVGVKVSSDGTLDLKGTIATLNGQLTHVKGGLIKLG